MTQMLIDSRFADAQLCGDFAVRHPKGETHPHHPAVLFGQRVVYQSVEPGHILRVGPLVIFSLVNIERVEIVESFAHRKIAEMLHTGKTDAGKQIGASDGRQIFPQHRLEDIVHNVFAVSGSCSRRIASVSMAG